jgi:plastocyanin
MKTKNIVSAFIFCCLISMGTISCSKSGAKSSGNGSGGNGGGVAGNLVDITGGMSFSPGTITVKVGTTVKWTNSDYYSSHTVTSDDGTSFNSGSVASGSSFSYTPTAAGTFPYHCSIHAGMNGTLVVTP